MTHPTPGGFRGYYMLSVPVYVCPSFRASRQRWPRSGQHGSAGREAGRAAGRTAVSDDHARPRTTAHDHARRTAHDHARPPHTTTHDHARGHARPPRMTTHDRRARPRTTAHDRPRLPYLFEEAVPTPPQGGLGRLGG